jgi:hypothetical protein
MACGEIKCPATQVLYSATGKHADSHNIPLPYWDQIQTVMNMNGWPFGDFVVYTPAVTEVVRAFRDVAYFEGTILPALHEFYFKELVPCINARLAGQLQPGAVRPAMVLPSLREVFGKADWPWSSDEEEDEEEECALVDSSEEAEPWAVPDDHVGHKDADASCGASGETAAGFGAAGVIVVGTPEETAMDCAAEGADPPVGESSQGLVCAV